MYTTGVIDFMQQTAHLQIDMDSDTNSLVLTQLQQYKSNDGLNEKSITGRFQYFSNIPGVVFISVDDEVVYLETLDTELNACECESDPDTFTERSETAIK